ncbi:unnamed protein product [Urochloa humidicola]
MASKRSKRVASCLPGEIISEILLLLPARSVLRFRAVCRQWAAHLSSPGFLGSYAARAGARRVSNPKLVIFAAPPGRLLLQQQQQQQRRRRALHRRPPAPGLPVPVELAVPRTRALLGRPRRRQLLGVQPEHRGAQASADAAAACWRCRAPAWPPTTGPWSARSCTSSPRLAPRAARCARFTRSAAGGGGRLPQPPWSGSGTTRWTSPEPCRPRRR